jgi:hypothetical protein
MTQNGDEAENLRKANNTINVYFSTVDNLYISESTISEMISAPTGVDQIAPN